MSHRATDLQICIFRYRRTQARKTGPKFLAISRVFRDAIFAKHSICVRFLVRDSRRKGERGRAQRAEDRGGWAIYDVSKTSIHRSLTPIVAFHVAFVCRYQNYIVVKLTSRALPLNPLAGVLFCPPLLRPLAPRPDFPRVLPSPSTGRVLRGGNNQR